VLLAVLGLIVGTASSAVAGVFQPETSTFTFKLAALPSVVVFGKYSGGGYAALTDNGSDHDLADTTGIWATAGNSPGTSLFTGVAVISDIILSITNEAGLFTPAFSAANSVGGFGYALPPTPYSGTLCPTGCLGGTETVNGQIVVFVAGTGVPFDAGIIGIGGTNTIMLPNTPSGLVIQATGGPFVTGKVKITGIVSNVIQLPNRSPVETGIAFTLDPKSTEITKKFTTAGGFETSNPTGALSTVASVTVQGTNSLTSASGNGSVTLISPLRIDTGILAGVLPGAIYKTFVFVPEPGTLLLLASGAAGLVVLGRRRIRK
jgi:hypothetical protein